MLTLHYYLNVALLVSQYDHCSSIRDTMDRKVHPGTEGQQASNTGKPDSYS